MAYELNQEECLELQTELDEFLRLSDSSSALLCDKGGAVLVDSGSDEENDLMAALTAGSFAATRELARTVGEEDFEAVYHQGEKRNLYIAGMCEEVILLAVFEQENSQVGLVRMMARKLRREINQTLDSMANKKEVVAEDPTVSFVLKK
ncbi:roadblock/LC7 domain-containing protein [Lentisphaera marina]|uniref:roadblock/LC7 domain-containing protein n=1 Tax=Lentisphaera marina TaxID=1111041 RepID=UPI002366106C|nr:roadblock/LC7 domain-containing protein [Lentisphaera marina]MDD7986966.1 roadblock/LC7 domain-containing protein [Lentisphaera marina]